MKTQNQFTPRARSEGLEKHVTVIAFIFFCRTQHVRFHRQIELQLLSRKRFYPPPYSRKNVATNFPRVLLFICAVDAVSGGTKLRLDFFSFAGQLICIRIHTNALKHQGDKRLKNFDKNGNVISGFNAA